MHAMIVLAMYVAFYLFSFTLHTMTYSDNTTHIGHSELGYDCVINYKTQDVAKELAAFAPDGISGLHHFAITHTH